MLVALGCILIPVIIYMDLWLAIIIYSLIVIVIPFMIFVFEVSKSKCERYFIKFMMFLSFFYIWFGGSFVLAWNELGKKIDELSSSAVIQYIDSFESDYVRYVTVVILFLIVFCTTITPFIAYLINFRKIFKVKND
ncbi:hypothetical protein V6W72_09315 [Mannheimia sp. HC-2023]